MSGGLSPAASILGNIDPRSFLSGLCSGGALSSISGVGFHPYSYPVMPSYAADWNAWNQMAGTQTSLRSILAACGFASLPIYITEYGAPTNGPGIGASLTNLHLGELPDHVDEATQAAMATESVHLAKADPRLVALFWYSNTDRGVAPTTNENFFGLRRNDGSAKPAYAALAAALRAKS